MTQRVMAAAVLVCAGSMLAGGDAATDQPAATSELDEVPTLPGCNAADMAEPFGIMTVDDMWVFVNALAVGDAAADIAVPFGVIDLADIEAFIDAYLADCR